MRVEVNGKEFDVKMLKNKLIVNNREIAFEKEADDEIVVENKKFRLDFYEEGEQQTLLIINGMAYVASKKSVGMGSSKEIKSPINGRVIDVLAQIGYTIERGNSIVVLEAMKMYNEVKSPITGKVKDIRVKKGGSVKAGDVMVVFE